VSPTRTSQHSRPRLDAVSHLNTGPTRKTHDRHSLEVTYV